jgi:hypothetical protein
MSLTQLPVPPVPSSLAIVSNVSLSPVNHGIDVKWSPVSGATSYKIYYSTSFFDSSSTTPDNTKDSNGTSTSYSLSGLTNGTQYFVAVKAIAQPTYYFAVTAAIDPNLSPSTPGSANESNYSTEISQVMDKSSSASVNGQLSSTKSAIAEPLVAYPNLKNEGCFIATAAYGFYSAPHVQVLRDFRDHYLLTNEPGRAFVAWYYRYGPHGARFINQYPVLKPLVRLALLPLVAVALFLISTPVAVKVTVLFCFILSSAYLARKRILLCSGGVQ